MIRTEYGTDGNVYELSISNGREYEQMTCQDCKHFYNREQKPWRTDKDLCYCDHSREGKIEVNRNCPVNKWCDNKFEPKEDSWESVSK